MLAPNLHVNKLLNMKKSHMENKQTISHGFFDANKFNKTSTIGGDSKYATDTGNRFATLANTAKSPSLDADQGMRVNVS